MLAPPPKIKRLLEAVQLVLTFVSVCAVLESIRPPASLDLQPGYFAGAPYDYRAARDRRLADLARSERKRREADQQSSRRAGEQLAHTLSHRRLDG